ncbi:MAG: hypothetical protein ACP5HQ_07695 [Thermoprotei archaeon]
MRLGLGLEVLAYEEGGETRLAARLPSEVVREYAVAKSDAVRKADEVAANAVSSCS